MLQIRDVYPILDFSILDPVSGYFIMNPDPKRWIYKEFKFFIPKTFLLLSRKYDPTRFVSDPRFFYPGSRGKKISGSRIRNTAPNNMLFDTLFWVFGLFVVE